MPHVVNGIGTWYWGKDNLRACRDRCEFCGFVGELRSYDTRTYVVVLFIPVVPLGRKRVLGECPRCRKHRVVKYADWRRGVERDLPEAVQALDAAPQDPEAAKRALGLSVFFQEESHLPQIAATCRRSLARDFGVQTLLAGAFEFFGRDADAEAIFRACVERDNSFEAREALARNLLFQSRPDEAWDLLSHVLTERRPQGRGLLLLVADGYQAWGMHAAALDVLNASVETFPELRSDPDYLRIQKSALKYKDTSKPIKSKLLVAPKTSSGGVRRMTSRVPMAIAASIVLAALLIFTLLSRDIASARTVYVVNGLSAPYDVVLNGRRSTVRPKAFRRVEFKEGDVAVAVLGEGITVPDQTFRVTTNFFARPFTDPVFILNPDRTALILREEAEYRADSGTAPPNALKFYCGDLFLDLGDADFRFQDFPDRIRLPSGSPVRRVRVTHLGDLPAGQVAAVLAAEQGADGLRDWIRRLADHDADNAVTAGLVAGALEPAEAIRILGDLRSRRPIRVEAHRAYQQVVEVAEPDRDLVAEYRALLAEDPGDPLRAYLLGRVTPDAVEAEALFHQGRNATPPCPHSLSALAFNRLVAGEFDEALPLAQGALASAPEHPTFRKIHRWTLEALGRFEDALADLRKDKAGLDPTEEEIYLMARAGKERELKKKLTGIVDDYIAAGRAEDGRQLRQSHEAMLAYVKGAPSEMNQFAENLPMPEMRFARAATMGDFDAAAAALPDLPRDRAFSALLLSLTAREAGQGDRADEFMKVALAALPAEGADARRAVPWLTGEAVPQIEDALHIALLPGQKTVLLVALGYRFPEHRDRCFALARRLNFDARFPHLLVERLTE